MRITRTRPAPKKREAEERLENLNELVNAATLFVHENEDDSLTAFLAHASLEAGEHQAGDQDDALHLMTVHAAKGLEFHTVFITGLEEGLFPHQNSIDTDGGLDEERRLMYVAITRARRRLYLSFAQSRMLHGQVNYGMASSFLRELPDNLLHWLTPRMAQRAMHLQPCISRPSPARMRSPSRRGSSGPRGEGRLAQRPGGVSHQIRRRNDRQSRRQRGGCARAGEFPQSRGEVAGAGVRQADGDVAARSSNSRPALE